MKKIENILDFYDWLHYHQHPVRIESDSGYDWCYWKITIGILNFTDGHRTEYVYESDRNKMLTMEQALRNAASRLKRSLYSYKKMLERANNG